MSAIGANVAYIQLKHPLLRKQRRLPLTYWAPILQSW